MARAMLLAGDNSRAKTAYQDFSIGGETQTDDPDFEQSEIRVLRTPNLLYVPPPFVCLRNWGDFRHYLRDQRPLQPC